MTVTGMRGGHAVVAAWPATGAVRKEGESLKVARRGGSVKCPRAMGGRIGGSRIAGSAPRGGTQWQALTLDERRHPALQSRRQRRRPLGHEVEQLHRVERIGALIAVSGDRAHSCRGADDN